jgi:hypothetical protein
MRLGGPLTPTLTVAVCPKMFGGIDHSFEGEKPTLLIGFLWLVAPFQDATFSVAATIDSHATLVNLFLQDWFSNQMLIIFENATLFPSMKHAKVGLEEPEFPAAQSLPVNVDFFVWDATLDAGKVKAWGLTKGLYVGFLDGPEYA